MTPLPTAAATGRLDDEMPVSVPQPDPRPTPDAPAPPPAISDAAATAPERDRVDESSDASFPASDPPSWWSGH